MRKDMGKVITERPRSGGGIKTPKGWEKRYQKIDLDERPKREKIRQKWKQSYTSKNFTDVIVPLRGYILKNIGRPWNKVWSDISATLPANGGMSYDHARRHIFDFVELNVDIIDGIPCHRGRFSGCSISSLAYVCPKTGLLKKTPKREYKYRDYDSDPKITMLDSLHFAAQYEDVWYVYTLAPVVINDYYRNPYRSWGHVIKRDIFLNFDVSNHNETRRKRKYGGNYYAASRLQMNSKEIKKFKLNAPIPQLPNVLGPKR